MTRQDTIVNATAQRLLLALGLGLAVLPAGATDLTLKLAGNESISSKTVTFQCDAQASNLGLPAESFSVEYVNGAGNSLAILPIKGESLIFSNVISGSGARYAARQYIWWDAGNRGVTLHADGLNGKKQTSCKAVGNRM